VPDTSSPAARPGGTHARATPDAVDAAAHAAAHDAARVAARTAAAVADAPGAAGRRPHVVIIGGGFGGLHAARTLRKAPVDVTLVDRTNHHLFQPLLYQVATAVLAPTDITIPIRFVLRRQRNTTVLMADVKGIDADARTVYLDDERRPLRYDYLILAPGARHSYFGKDEWETDAPGLKTIADAYEMRRRFLTAFEMAEKATSVAERDAWMTFVVIGGGPTGVELAGMIPATAETFRTDFRNIDTCRTRVLLLEGGARVLAAFPEDLSVRARRDLEDLDVEVRTGQPVTQIEPGAVEVGGERIATHTVFWAAGNAASPLGRMLGAPVDRAGRVQVEPDLSVPGRPEVFVVGDAAAVVDRGKPVPGVAQGAIQGGQRAAKNLIATLDGKPRQPFEYWNKGDLATIGRHRAVANFGGRLKFGGTLAWLLWVFIHILYLAGFRNRVSVLVQWAYAYFTYHRGARLISGQMAQRESTGVPSEPPASSPSIPMWGGNAPADGSAPADASAGAPAPAGA
jgi:NADH dehydrogenase